MEAENPQPFGFSKLASASPKCVFCASFGKDAGSGRAGRSEARALGGLTDTCFPGWGGSGDTAAASPKLASKEPVQPQGKEAVFSPWE